MKAIPKYTTEKVRKLRTLRSQLKSNGSSEVLKTDADYQSFLGQLKGAGHLVVNGHQKTSIQIDRNWSGQSTKVYTLEYEVGGIENSDKPHFTGYVQSASNVDTKPYKVNAWLNEGGSIRIEIIEK